MIGSTLNLQLFKGRLSIEQVVQDALLSGHKEFRMSKLPRHRPIQPRCEVSARQDAGGSEPLTGVEDEFRRLSARIDFAQVLPVVIEPIRVSLRLFFIIYKERRTTVVPHIQDRSSEDCVGVEHQKSLPRWAVKRFQLYKSPAVIARGRKLCCSDVPILL